MSMNLGIDAKALDRIGRKTKKNLYSLNKNIHFINHPANSTVLKQISLKELQLKIECENLPERWFKQTKKYLFDQNRLKLAEYLDLNEEQIIFTNNDQTSWKWVLKVIIKPDSNDCVLVNEHINEEILRILKKFPIKIVKIPHSNTIDGILDGFYKCRNANVRAIILEHVGFNTTFVYPLNQIINSIKKIFTQNPFVLVDGTNALGQVDDLRIGDVHCDFYVTNLNKWYFAPRGSSFLYANNSRYTNKFPNQEPSDCYLLVKDCLHLYENYFGGLTQICKYTSRLMSVAVGLLTRSWKTETYELVDEFEANFMRLIELPQMDAFFYSNEFEAFDVIERLTMILLDDFDIDACFVYLNGKIYCRVSFFIYNTISDYVALSEAILNCKTQVTTTL